jgi:shikimate kinase
MRNIVLIGMPGSGKSTVGVLAAKALGLDFLDTDLLLQKREGLRLADILERDGPDGFLDAESRMLVELEASGTVIATGGSAVYHETGMERLKNSGLVVWIDVTFSELRVRLGDLRARGVVLAPGQSLLELHVERKALYEQWADERLEVDSGENLDTTAARLVALIHEEEEEPQIDTDSHR